MAEAQIQLATAESTIERARQAVERQKQLIAGLERAGADSVGARQTLDVFETTLRTLKAHRDYRKHRSGGR
jgi:hypothetical protein